MAYGFRLGKCVMFRFYILTVPRNPDNIAVYDISLVGIFPLRGKLLELNLLPLTEATFYILLSLSSGRKHGYAILKDISILSGGILQVSTSTLYGALGRMQERGLIIRVENGPDEVSGPGLPRKTYELTDLGRRILEAELVRMRRQMQAAQLSLGQESQL
jgi:DNA-binding PadR family transcriptional regulator